MSYKICRTNRAIIAAAVFLFSAGKGLHAVKSFLRFSFLSTAALILLAGASLEAADIVVASTADTGFQSLRQGITAARPGDTIVFNIPTTQPGYDPKTGVFTIGLTSGQIQIAEDLNIAGPTDAKIVISGSNLSRVFDIVAGTVNISNVTVTKGTVVGARGVLPNPGGSAQGGGLQNASFLNLTNVSFIANRCVGGDGALNVSGQRGSDGGSGFGGAIYNSGAITLINCTFSGNNAAGGQGGIPSANGGTGNGGAIYTAQIFKLTNCTISANSATGGAPAGGDAASGAANGGGLVQSPGNGTVETRSTIIAGNTLPGSGTNVAPDVSGNVTSFGFNLIGRTDGNSGWIGSDHLGGTTDATKLNPLLAPVADNGGVTVTMIPKLGSPAIDGGDDSVLSPPLSVTTDQRNFARKNGVHVDVGSVETGPAQAGPSFVVTNVSEHDDGTCTVDDCTLLEAINASNANANANTITFASGVSGIIVNSTVGGLTITNPVTLNGPGARVLTVSGNNVARVFAVNPAVTANFNGLTIAKGSSAGPGGGIYNDHGTVSVADCTISGNTAFSGGGIYNRGVTSGSATLSVKRSTISGNIANGSLGVGGAIDSEGVNGGSASVTLTNCTVTGNTAPVIPGAAGLLSFGSGGTASVILINCTFNSNAITNDTSTLSLANTILNAGSGGATVTNSNGTVTSQGHNLSSDNAGGFLVGAGDKPNTNPMLDTLKNNGGPSDTLALLAGSPAINAGDDTKAPATDERVFTRAGVSDIGAFELNGIMAVLKITSIVRLTTGHIILQGLGLASAIHNVEASPDPNVADFNFLGQATSNAAGNLQFDDAGAVGLTKRFYRITLP
jgi:hypothetical protein